MQINQYQEMDSYSFSPLHLQLIRMEYRSETMRLEWAGMTSLHFKEDVNCGCKCKVRPSDCRPDRELFTNCQCQCMVELDCPINFRWDPLSCDCVCDVPWSDRYIMQRFILQFYVAQFFCYAFSLGGGMGMWGGRS